MANLNELLKSKKVHEFVRNGKSRPWTIDQAVLTPKPTPPISEPHIVQNESLAMREHSENNKIIKKENVDKPLVNKQITNGVQLDNKQITIRLQTDNKKSDKNNKRITQGLTKQITNGVQLDNKQITNLTIETLVGHEKKLLLFINEECRLIGDLITSPITNELIRNSLNCSMNTAKMIIHRLVKKGFIKRHESKKGRGGWTKFGLSKDLYQKLNQITNRQQMDNKWGTQGLTQGLTSLSSSSSDLNIYKTTTGEDGVQNQSTNGFFKLSPEWQEVDIEALSSIGFSKHHLIQIARQELLTTDLVQDSINAFAFDLKTNGKEKGINSPINFFMGILRKGMPYTPPDNYVSPREAAIRKILEIRKKEEESAKELKELEFRKWLRETPVEEKKKLVGESYGIKYTEESPLILARLRGHYNEK